MKKSTDLTDLEKAIQKAEIRIGMYEKVLKSMEVEPFYYLNNIAIRLCMSRDKALLANLLEEQSRIIEAEYEVLAASC